MIHTNRVVTVGDQESIIDKPIILYRGDREVEVEFELIGNEFMFSTDGNVIKSVNASHGQLVLNTPSGDNMFSALAECHDGKVVFVITKDMIDEFIETGFYSFQIRLYDGELMKSRVTIPPVFSGLDIRNPIAAEDETNVVGQAVVDYARIYRDQSNEELPTFDWQGNYVKTDWAQHDVITENKMNKIEDGLWTINNKVSESDNVFLKKAEQLQTQHQNDMNKLNTKDTQLTNDIQNVNRTLTNELNKLKVDVEVGDVAWKNELTEYVEGELENFSSRLDDRTHISVKEFGAVGDGRTDDTQAFFDCITYALTNHKSVYIPGGVYILSPNVLSFTLTDEQNFVITGDGPNSTLKRKDQTTMGDWHTLFRIMASADNTRDIELVKIQDIKINSNATNQQQPSSDYAFEHCADFYINGNSNSRLNTVHIDNVSATDGVADHIYIAGSTDAYVDNFFVNNFQCDYRTRTRSDLCVTGHIKTAMFSNIKCIVLEYEFNNASGLGPSYIFIDNLESERIDITGAGLHILASNLKVHYNCHFGNLTGKISNGIFGYNGSRLVSNPDLTFMNCIFMLEPDASGETTEISLQYPNKITYHGCDFKINGDLDHYSGNLFKAYPRSDAGITVTFRECTFDPRAEIAINIDRCGYGYVYNCRFENNIPILLNGGTSYHLCVIIQDVIVDGNGYCFAAEGGGLDKVEIYNMICNEKCCRIRTANSQSLTYGYLLNDRKIYTTVPLTKDWFRNTINNGNRNMPLMKGDKFININSTVNEPESWVVTKTSYGHDLSVAVWPFIACGDSFGTTAERPTTCYLHKGYRYFDTDLGKHVTWNGSAWIE